MARGGNINRRSLLRGAALAATAIGMPVAVTSCSKSSSSGGGGFPTRSITLTVQAAAGGGSDLASRSIAKVLEKELGRSFVVENRPGASGSIAVKYVSHQKPDGYHIGFCPVELAMFDYMGYGIKPDSVELLGQIMNQPATIAVPTNSPYKDLKGLMNAAKTTKITVANSGAGSSWEACTKMLGQLGGVQFSPVPFDGGAPAVTAAMGGKVNAVIAGVGETKTGVDAGKLRVLAIFSEKPHPEPAFAKIPTGKSQGYDLVFGSWGGLYAPKGLPADVKTKLENAIQKAAKDPAYTKPITQSGTLVVYRNSADFTKFVNSEYQRFGKVLGKS